MGAACRSRAGGAARVRSSLVFIDVDVLGVDDVPLLPRPAGRSGSRSIWRALAALSASGPCTGCRAHLLVQGLGESVGGRLETLQGLVDLILAAALHGLADLL